MHNFDQDKPTVAQQFVLHGETLTLRRSVQPEKIARFEDAEEGGTAQQKLAMIDEAMLEMLRVDDHDKWRAIRADDSEDAVGLDLLAEVVRFCIGAVSGRPPTQPASSSESHTEPGTPSTDESQQPVGLISVPST